jgi:hypothetical protein
LFALAKGSTNSGKRRQEQERKKEKKKRDLLEDRMRLFEKLFPVLLWLEVPIPTIPTTSLQVFSAVVVWMEKKKNDERSAER